MKDALINYILLVVIGALSMALLYSYDQGQKAKRLIISESGANKIAGELIARSIGDCVLEAAPGGWTCTDAHGEKHFIRK